MDRWMDGWTDGRTHVRKAFYNLPTTAFGRRREITNVCRMQIAVFLIGILSTINEKDRNNSDKNEILPRKL